MSALWTKYRLTIFRLSGRLITDANYALRVELGNIADVVSPFRFHVCRLVNCAQASSCVIPSQNPNENILQHVTWQLIFKICVTAKWRQLSNEPRPSRRCSKCAPFISRQASARRMVRVSKHALQRWHRPLSKLLEVLLPSLRYSWRVA
jgi:hypothetical protein